MLETAINTYVNGIDKVVEAGSILGKIFVEELKKVIPDIEYSLGWEEAGVDTLCFQSANCSVSKKGFNKNNVGLDDIIVKFFPELQHHVETPFGVYLSPKEAKEVREAMRRIKVKLI
jgi:hypothetical protein